MIQRNLFLFLVFLVCSPFIPVFAQNRSTSPEELLRTGISFYGEGKFSEALTLLRLAGPVPEAMYWISLAEISSGDYGQALLDLDALEKADPSAKWSAEAPYHRGRCFFYLGRHEEALVTLTDYLGRLPEADTARRAASWYWMGESLLALGRLDNAADAFSTVVEKYPSSVKYEAAAYRLELINQKKIEAELLAILKWSHEESLKTMGEYQAREKTYDQTIAAYQQRIAEMLANGPVLSDADGDYQSQLAAAEIRIAALEASLNEANAALMELRGSGIAVPGADAPKPLTNTEKALRLMELKAAALELSNALNRRLNGEDI
ncbi:MAG: tetratricopeptide repeat protein [Treponema sp.]|jgi:tetratricopeptide (TPR) repeat protein|nr:tetratricopeptide repeat protein [Treponema sp.]